VVGVSRFVRNSDRKVSEQGGNQIQRGVCRFGEDSETTRSNADNDFSARNKDGGRDGISSHRALLGAHGIGRVKGRRPGHDGIIAADAELRQENR